MFILENIFMDKPNIVNTVVVKYLRNIRNVKTHFAQDEKNANSADMAYQDRTPRVYIHNLRPSRKSYSNACLYLKLSDTLRKGQAQHCELTLESQDTEAFVRPT
jgi:hypothetical protein